MHVSYVGPKDRIWVVYFMFRHSRLMLVLFMVWYVTGMNRMWYRESSMDNLSSLFYYACWALRIMFACVVLGEGKAGYGSLVKLEVGIRCVQSDPTIRS